MTFLNVSYKLQIWGKYITYIFKSCHREENNPIDQFLFIEAINIFYQNLKIFYFLYNVEKDPICLKLPSNQKENIVFKKIRCKKTSYKISFHLISCELPNLPTDISNKKAKLKERFEARAWCTPFNLTSYGISFSIY